MEPLRKHNRFGMEAARCVLAAFIIATVPMGAMAAEEEEPAPGSAITGSVAMDVNTHFMSYGLNVWQKEEFEDTLYNPSLQIDIALPAGFSIYGGTWWDVNDNAGTNVGNDIQEVDVWVGAAFSQDIFSASVTYQEWYYASDVERILDVGIGLDVLLSPSITIHNRVGNNGAQRHGTVGVFGLSHTFDFDVVNFTPHAEVAAVTKGYYVRGEGGFGYAKAGLGAGIPIPLPVQYGEWSVNGDVSYYYTDDDNIDNTTDNVVTATGGISLAF